MKNEAAPEKKPAAFNFFLVLFCFPRKDYDGAAAAISTCEQEQLSFFLSFFLRTDRFGTTLLLPSQLNRISSPFLHYGIFSVSHLAAIQQFINFQSVLALVRGEEKERTRFAPFSGWNHKRGWGKCC